MIEIETSRTEAECYYTIVRSGNSQTPDWEEARPEKLRELSSSRINTLLLEASRSSNSIHCCSIKVSGDLEVDT